MSFFLLFVEILICIHWIESSVYLYDTEDGHEIEYYDCFYYQPFRYCRRPGRSINLDRETTQLWRCYHHGTRHSFESLPSMNITIDRMITEWRSTLEMIDRYVQSNKDEKYLCQCIDERSFGKFCEYRFAIGKTFDEAVEGQLNARRRYEEEIHFHQDILCYETIDCHSGVLCLDWRQICDGIQQCVLGIDEEHCHSLEYHQCQSNEYRCLNGMCIRKEYFLDGDFDCMDSSDEQVFFNDQQCFFDQVRFECDEHFCLSNQWSCRDGQCIHDRLAFQEDLPRSITCANRRDRYFMCEADTIDRMWTLPKGTCYRPVNYRQLDTEENLPITKEELCQFYLRCSLADNIRNGCPCQIGDYCFPTLPNPCEKEFIPYPTRPIITSYIQFLYNTRFEKFQTEPDLIQINGSIKCRGYSVEYQTIIPYSSKVDFRQLEYQICTANNATRQESMGYDLHCWQNEDWIDVCLTSKECLSTYRIHDGYIDCADQSDEILNQSIRMGNCSSEKDLRFTCSKQESACLPVHRLGDLSSDCQNHSDEYWMGNGINLSKLKCRSIDQCQFLRHYIEISSSIDLQSDMNVFQLTTQTIPFRSYCDTFWDLSFQIDEDRFLCEKYWICLSNQWQCRSGQCIDIQWVVDGEWDCLDASDEQAIYLFNHHQAKKNSHLQSKLYIDHNFHFFYGLDQSWKEICDIRTEFACYRLNRSESSNDFCLPLDKIGDGSIDCLGGFDERNTLNYCGQTTMLGYGFKCLSSNRCRSPHSLCQQRCPDFDDDQWICSGRYSMSHCSTQSEMSYTCLNGECINTGRCPQVPQCLTDEDQYWCLDSILKLSYDFSQIYRREKELRIRYDNQFFQLPRYPPNQTFISFLNRSKPQSKTLDNQSLLAFYYCNRGLGVYDVNQSIICFCSEQYYGDRCQFYQDRLTFLFHIDYSHYFSSKHLLKYLVLFLLDDQVLNSYEFHSRSNVELTKYVKRTHTFVYSRSSILLQHKQN